MAGESTPRVVRNFWITADIDGHKNHLRGGPRNKDGGIDVTIKMRDEGEVIEALRIKGFANADGTLRLIVSEPEIGDMLEVRTQR
jgi:hypothetical protein